MKAARAPLLHVKSDGPVGVFGEPYLLCAGARFCEGEHFAEVFALIDAQKYTANSNLMSYFIRQSRQKPHTTLHECATWNSFLA